MTCSNGRLHSTRIVAWDVPPAVIVGGKFRLKLGLKCSHGCRLERMDFIVCDGAGNQVAAGLVGGEIWRGSASLFFGEVEVNAPASEGHHLWKIKAPAWIAKVAESAVEIPHEQRAISFEVRSVLPPDFLIRVEVLDAYEKTPMVGASVIVYPYRAITDDHGVAEISVAKGQHRVQVSQTNHFASNRLIEVIGDMDICVELKPEPEYSPDDRYVW